MVKVRDVALIGAAVAAIAAFVLFRPPPPEEQPPTDSGGQVTIKLEMPVANGYGSPALPLDVTYTITGMATGGTQPIDMALGAEIYSDTLATWVSAPGGFVANVPLNIQQSFKRTLTPTDLGNLTGRTGGTFRIRGIMTLTNILGAFGFKTAEATFNIAVPPTGTVGVGTA